MDRKCLVLIFNLMLKIFRIGFHEIYFNSNCQEIKFISSVNNIYVQLPVEKPHNMLTKTKAVLIKMAFRRCGCKQMSLILLLHCEATNEFLRLAYAKMAYVRFGWSKSRFCINNNGRNLQLTTQ